MLDKRTKKMQGMKNNRGKDRVLNLGEYALILMQGEFVSGNFKNPHIAPFFTKNGKLTKIFSIE